ncbi:hypothetical protein Egran_02159 [Elaphomyces granulatus]|uniref:Ams2/SPT21 N-terminal domain-containing protein n=1 Tax=Elaphomyces granulatus TaxID=519963 RepID=A0A232M176_9EURO|nr:hypothetical protein Egran_02159 [Elaphomyces granulatus]
MESQDGVSVRSMRLKVLYTFDAASQTNCLARWPHLLNIQTAYLDEGTQIGVVELKTCIQAIVSASPELVAKLGQDYTVYAYDYSEYETPLVGQGMLSWVLASAPPTSHTAIITGRVCKNVLGLFAKGAQETLEVKLRLVPVPTVLQSEYLESMQKYRELSSIIPQDFDAQMWTTFIQQNSNLISCAKRPQPATERLESPIDHSGIERLHQLLSESSTPRDLPTITRSESPTQSPLPLLSRVSTPSGYQTQPQPVLQHKRSGSDAPPRPSSRTSTQEIEYQRRPSTVTRRGSIQSGYGSGEETSEQIPRKRAKVFRAECPGKEDMNIEKQPGSLRVAASTAASVRIHRPVPINPMSSISQASNEEPIRPPTPISRPSNDVPRRARPPSILRASSSQDTLVHSSAYLPSDDCSTAEPATTSPEETRYQGIFEPQFIMPSSPPVMDAGFPNCSSPVLPPLPMIPDSGFMSGSIEDLLDDDLCLQTIADDDMESPLDELQRADSNDIPSQVPTVEEHTVEEHTVEEHTVEEHTVEEPTVEDLTVEEPTVEDLTVEDLTVEEPADLTVEEPAVEDLTVEKPTIEEPTVDTVAKETLPLDGPAGSAGQQDDFLAGDGPLWPVFNDLVPLPPRSSRATGSRPTSRAGGKAQQKPLAPAPISQSEVEQLMNAVVMPSTRPLQHAHSWTGPLNDFPLVDTPAPHPAGEPKVRSGTGSKRLRQVQARLDQCVREGQIPPFCENCGAIETPTWRRAWSKEVEGSEQDANQLANDPMVLFWQVVDKDKEDRIIKFKVFKNKKTLADADKSFVQILLCNPCGLWLQKFKNMRPENMWTKPAPSTEKKKRSSRSRKDRPKNRNRPQTNRAAESSPGPTDASSPAGEDNDTPRVENDNDNEDLQDPPSKRRRANSVEPQRTIRAMQAHWEEQDAIEALKRAIQSSPARNQGVLNISMNENSLTPKRVRRTSCPSSHDRLLKPASDSLMNSPRRSPRVASRSSEKTTQDKENHPPVNRDSLEELFDSSAFEFGPPTTPTPKQRNLQAGGKRLFVPFSSPTARKGRGNGSQISPATLTSKRLQDAQGTNSETSRDEHEVDEPFGPNIPELPSLGGGSPRSALEGIDGMVTDMFDDDVVSIAHTDFYPFERLRSPPSHTWDHWVPSDYVSPTGSNAEGNNVDHNEQGVGHSNIFSTTDDSEDIINAILSDPDMQNTALCESQFGSLIFEGSATG